MSHFFKEFTFRDSINTVSVMLVYVVIVLRLLESSHVFAQSTSPVDAAVQANASMMQAMQKSLSGITDDIIVTPNPQYPTPNQNVSITLQSHKKNLGQAQIAWFVNGTLKKQGTGVTSFSINAGSAGTLTAISIKITLEDGFVTTKILQINPSTINLIVEGSTYTPPFYRGRSLPVAEARNTITALPIFIANNGRAIDPDTLVYSWKKDGQLIGDQSGIGKSSIVLRGTFMDRPSEITVDVASPTQSLRNTKKITLEFHKPQIIFYEHSPLEGINYNRALTTYSPQSKEFSIRAEPFYFSIEDILNNLTYYWSLNGQTIQNQATLSNEVVFRRNDNSTVSANIGLKIIDYKKLFQEGEAMVGINAK